MIARLPLPLLFLIVLSSASACARGTLTPRPEGEPRSAMAESGTILRASFKGRIDLGDGPRRFEGTLAAGAPGSLRLEVTGPLGGVRALIAAGEERVLVLCPGTREYLDEAATARVYESLLGLRLDTRALVGLIRLGDEDVCPAGTCQTIIPMQADGARRGRVLIVTRQGATLSARPGDSGAGLEGLRSLELRLDDAVVTREANVPGDLFAPRVPAGWTRVRLESLPTGGLLPQPR